MRRASRLATIDRAARRIIEEAGYGDAFMHRTGHGIGVEVHEEPYIVESNDEPLVAGNAFSVEPGIYIADHWGARIEDIVVCTDAGGERLNTNSTDLGGRLRGGGFVGGRRGAPSGAGGGGGGRR